jgi:Outer membrane efflux protein
VSTGKGELQDWAVGVNLALPVGLRQGRATLREAELTIARDRANLEQGLHAAAHDLAESVRGLAQEHSQYRAYQKARALARESLEKQLDVFQTKAGGLYLNVLQAIAEWGNAVSAEGFALAQYNTELANLARQTGTILDTHEIRFFEERYLSVGPLGKHGPLADYPEAMVPTPNANRYPVSTEGPEAALEKDKPKLPKGPRDLPPPGEVPPPTGLPKDMPNVSGPPGGQGRTPTDGGARPPSNSLPPKLGSH